MSNEIEDIEESEISGENGEVYVFQWLASTERKIEEVPIPALKSKQNDLEKSLIKIISAPEPFPSPGHALRNLVGRCLMKLYTRGETRTMFDTLQAFMKIVGDFKTADKDVNKVAAFGCMGDLMGAYGSQVMSLMAETVVVTLKTAKSSNTPLLRYQALVALRKSISTAKKAITDSATKDILKQMRNSLIDKSYPVQRAAAEVLIAMYSTSDGSYPTTSEIDAIVTTCVKSLDTADQITRHSLAQLVGHVLASTQIERAVPIPESASKNKKDQESADDDIVSPAHAAAEVTKPMFAPTEMLLHLSNHFNKPHTSRRTRIGIFDFYAALLTRLGATFVEANFSLIVSHLLTEIVSNPRIAALRYDQLQVRHLVGILLRDLIGVRVLSEQGQISAIQELANAYLKRWPAMMPGQVAPSSSVLVIVLREVAGLLQQLGNAPPPVQDALSDPLITLLSYPSHKVRVTASWALRCFCFSTPLRLPKSILIITEKLQRDLSAILTPVGSADSPLRALGHAYGLAALVSLIPERPLYVSYDVSAKVLDMATQILKRAGEHDLKVAGVEIEVAWTLIASLMSLGPNFVRPHLPQLLVLWRNALPKPTSKDTANNAGRSIAEWMFLLHVRESALGAILCFLQHNASTLVTLDVARRIASLLGNALSFANNFVGQHVEDPAESQVPQMLKKGLTIREREALLRRRVYQCFSALGFSSIAESTQTTLLQSAVSLFASSDGYAGSSVQAAITSSSGTFTSVWQSNDGYAYGVTSIQIVDFGGNDTEEQGDQNFLNRDSVEMSIDTLLRKPILGACEHDTLSLCQANTSKSDYQLVESPPPATSLVDTAIELFARLLPIQDLTSTTRIITHLLESVRSNKLEKNVGRKAAVFINGVVALAMALRTATTMNFRHAKDTFGSSQVTSLLSSFLKDAIIDGDLILRSAGSESIGRLASLSGTNYLTSQIKDLVDQVVSNRDPYGRAGCALAFGSIYSFVGGLAAGPLLKTTVNVLMSLSNDPHPVVHFWALNALSRVINAASLAYAPFVSSTLGMLLKVYLLESHEREGGSLGNANISGDCPAYPVVCQIIDAVITVLGPDMQDSPRTRTLVLNLVHEFSLEEEAGISVEAIKCIQHFLMFAPEHANIPDLVNRLRDNLSSSRRPLKLASINALYQLVQKDALAMSKLGGDRLVEDLFGMLDDDTSVQGGVRNVIRSWLQQTVIYNPSAWIDLCQRIMSRTTASQRVADAANRQNLRDDEGESLNVGNQQGNDHRGGNTHLSTSRWRTQLFSLQCLHEICTIVAKSGRQEHLNAIVARTSGIPTSGLLFTRVSDLIKMAFTASTAYVTEIRLEGLIVLRDVIQIFASSPDPAYEDALLLEQHQAPITSALTPAFSSDSTPEILSSAVHACALFVGCGVVKDVNRMGRILKLLTTALDQSKDTGMLSLGETGELSPNASAMLRISTLSSWAQLQVSSTNTQREYLVNVVKPYRETLASLWISSLRDYASIRIDSEVLNDTNSSVAIDSSYSSLGKEVLLPYYTQSWPVILQAVASRMQANDPYILAAMDGIEPTNKLAPAPTPTRQTKNREEPTAFFFILFGLIYEALSTSTPTITSPQPLSASSTTLTSTRQALTIPSLQALKSLVKPEYSGKALMEQTVFEEFVSLCYRMAMTESPDVLIHLVDVLVVMTKFTRESNLDMLAPNSPGTHCLRVCSHIIRHSMIPSSSALRNGSSPSERVALISSAFSAFTSVGSLINTSQREDTRGVAVLLYTELLKEEASDIDLVGSTLPALKSILEMPITRDAGSKKSYDELVHALLSCCLLNIDEMRGRQGQISTKKIKNNLLASVLILTIIPPDVKVGRAVVEHCCFIISQKLLALDEVSLTAAHCTKTLISTSVTGNALLRQCTRLLLPGLVEYIIKLSPLVHENKINEIHVLGIAEVWKGMNVLFGSVKEDEYKARLLGVYLPTLSLLLSTAATEPGKSDREALSGKISQQTVAQLLTYASSAPGAFKEATNKLQENVREIMEQSIKKAVVSGGYGSGGVGSGSENVKPQISLRSF